MMVVVMVWLYLGWVKEKYEFYEFGYVVSY